jgi:peptidoglycan L-alanyl-D-glutamate endopeptidase CwlK
MFKFSNESRDKVWSVNYKLRDLANEVMKITPIDFAVTCGIRTEQEQAKLFKAGKSKCDGIKTISKHQLGKAIDICPCINGKLDYGAEADLYFVIGLFYAEAKELKINIRVGALWDGESIKENGFVDGYHIELI